MNLYIYSDLLFNSDSQTSSTGFGSSSLLSYSKLLKDSNSRSQFFSNQYLPKKQQANHSKQKPPQLNENSASIERQTQTRTYLVDLNKQSLDSFSTLNLAAPPKSGTRANVYKKPNNETTRGQDAPIIGASRNPFEVIEGSRMKIGAKKIDDNSNSNLPPTQFRLKVFNGFAKNLPKIDQNDTSNGFEIRKSLYKSPFKPKILLSTNDLIRFYLNFLPFYLKISLCYLNLK